MAEILKNHRYGGADERSASPYCDYYGRQRPLGHQEGAPHRRPQGGGRETFRRIATYCKNIGVKYLTVYAFSTENWKRSESEVSAIMLLLKKYLMEAVDTMEKDHIRLHFFGDMTPIAPELRALARRPMRSRSTSPRTISRPTSASTTVAGTRFAGGPAVCR